MINPVLTKLATFATLTAARHIIGQPRTTLDLGAAVMDGQDRRSSTWRAASSAATWRRCSARCWSAPSTWPSSGRRRCRPTGAGAVLVAIDELQALPAVDYARLVGELRKYGGGFLLATQTLTGLDRLDPTLRPLLLGNCEALLAFRVAAEEAALLTAEFDELVTATDLTNLERGCAYLKASERGQPAPATWLRVHPPMAPDLALAAMLRARGRETWGVPAEAAAATVAAGRARVRALTELMPGRRPRRERRGGRGRRGAPAPPREPRRPAASERAAARAPHGRPAGRRRGLAARAGPAAAPTAAAAAGRRRPGAAGSAAPPRADRPTSRPPPSRRPTRRTPMTTATGTTRRGRR